MTTVQEKVLEIKRELRLSMNGVASESMRDGGIGYRLNFGVGLPKLKDIALAAGKDAQLATALWKEDIRECRILAALVYPENEFMPDLADVWVGEIGFPDLAEVCSMYLFSKMKDASVTAFQWIASGSEMVQYCGFLTIANMLRQGREMGPRYVAELEDQANAVIAAGAVLPAQAARAAMGFIKKDGQVR